MYYQGDTAVLVLTLLNEAGAEVEPGSLIVRVRAPDDTLSTLESASGGAVGVHRAELACQQTGRYHVYAETSAPASAEPHAIYVRARTVAAA